MAASLYMRPITHDERLADLDALTDLAQRPDWHRRAACRGVGPDRFYPTTGESHDAARALCERCPVIADCRAAGAHEKFGIWAGLSERARRAT